MIASSSRSSSTPFITGKTQLSCRLSLLRATCGWWMLGWGVLVTVATILALAPVFLGLLVVLPVLGHATWHLYRIVVVPDA